MSNPNEQIDLCKSAGSSPPSDNTQNPNCDSGVSPPSAVGVLSPESTLQIPSQSVENSTSTIPWKEQLTERYGIPWYETPENTAYRAAREACTSPRSLRYERTGAQGVLFLYKDLEDFLDDVGMRPDDKPILERIIPDGHYERGNLAWVPRNRPRRDLQADRSMDALITQIVTIVQRFEGKILRRTLRGTYCRGWSNEMFAEALSKLADLGFAFTVSDGKSLFVTNEKISKQIAAEYVPPKEPRKKYVPQRSLLPDKMPLTDRLVQVLKKRGGEITVHHLQRHSAAYLWGRMTFKPALQRLIDTNVVELFSVEDVRVERDGLGDRLTRRVKHVTKYVRFTKEATYDMSNG